MTKYLAYLSIFFLVACSNGSNNVVEKMDGSESNTPVNTSFSLEGQVDGAENLMFYVEAVTNRGKMPVASGKSNTKGQFKIEGVVPGFGEYYVRMGEGNTDVIPIVIVPGDNISLLGKKETFRSNTKFSGTEWSKALSGFLPHYAKFTLTMQEMKTKASSLSEMEQIEFYIDARKDVESFGLKSMKDDPGNPYNLILFKSTVPAYDSQIALDNTNNAILRNVGRAFERKFPNSPLTKEMNAQVTALETAELGSNGQSTAPNISLNNPDGKNMSLKDLRGQYVLIDFWASWCGPCRAESPNVVKMYNKYKNKGFTVFSVSLDDDLAKWKNAITKDGLIWPNHVSDLKRFQSPVASLYQISGIPHTVLIDKEGKIIGTGLRGVSLEWKLKEIFEN
jgi:thiol-disulfide isomerase/thioredoxin